MPPHAGAINAGPLDTDPPSERLILHVDMDAFFASVEQRDRPELRGRPVLVGGDGARGVVAAASYEARVFGCRSAMPTAVARRLCPHAVVVKGRFDAYREASRAAFGVFDRITPLVQPLSIDEAFLDCTRHPFPLDTRGLAQRVKDEVRAATGLTASVGAAPNKFLAKLASDLDKPDGLVVLTTETIRATLDPLPVTAIPGVGPAAERRLHRLGLRTLAHLAAASPDTLARVFGDWGRRLHELAHGRDDRAVTPDREAKSIGHEQTFGVDLADPDAARAVLLTQTEDVARRLRAHGLRARGVTLKLRFGDFTTITRAGRVEGAGGPEEAHSTHETRALCKLVRTTFDAWASQHFRPLRLVGVAATHLTREPQRQLALFADPKAEKRAADLDRATDAILQRFGNGAIRRAASLRPNISTGESVDPQDQ